jgi:hypothetical protein
MDERGVKEASRVGTRAPTGVERADAGEIRISMERSGVGLMAEEPAH